MPGGPDSGWYRQAGHEDPRAAQAVTETASYEEQSREHDRVGVDDPLQRARRGVQRAQYHRQRNIQDGVVKAPMSRLSHSTVRTTRRFPPCRLVGVTNDPGPSSVAGDVELGATTPL